ncbi:MAG: hypothetical protein KME35_05310 [Aphanocapsa sp. GSE-SYN-MK-11-07L]|jgi:hypothetical protein|nr:hypothetical protein [Aphanocapsa sp. GSE-SYN-MK-11-07L]
MSDLNRYHMETIKAIADLTTADQQIAELLQERNRMLQECVSLLRQEVSDIWVSADDFASTAQIPITPYRVMDDRREGRLKEGFHWINLSEGDRGTFVFCVRTCKAYYTTTARKRKPRA